MNPRTTALRKASSTINDFILSVLETSVTKRDARAYMNKFVPLLQKKGATGFEQQADESKSDSAQDPATSKDAESTGASAYIPQPVFVALVKIRAPQAIDDETLLGVGRSLAQLKKLGLTSIVVVDCDLPEEDEVERRRKTNLQAGRLATAIDKYDESGARMIQSPITIGDSAGKDTSPFTSDDLFVGNSKDLMDSLQSEAIPIIPSIGFTEDLCSFRSVDPNDAIIALARQLSGLQFLGQPAEDAQITRLLKLAEVYRVIIIDPVGGIPALNQSTGRYMFLNLEQEYEDVTKHLAVSSPESTAGPREDNYYHLKNAELARKTLSLLPPTASAIITTPLEAANNRSTDKDDLEWAMVGTRRKHNPLIHNLLTDRPMQSSSLPSSRIRSVTSSAGVPKRIGSLTTLAKRGMPLTMFPDPRVASWKPPQPGVNGLKLTDPNIDLGRLVHLINDSFGRELDVEHYLRRVENNLAGIVIAGEYEGGAILTWESPTGPDGAVIRDPSRMVPYLDKFAVLRKSQGAGGVADIVFNAMVRNCFPEGVCWRSRKDNPVNKWYFERSRGTMKIPDMNWTMFWTTSELSTDSQKFKDYESVCRGIEPSWADNKQILD
ncbi:Amino-acid acetyltransferase, mitochondrial [Neopestalotiopsis sp. 37M]|nr:Amino-acid acetyltransferase, mitochondrial [Neopestalotiopsis sp. 37M]